jgi:hypothetical protein
MLREMYKNKLCVKSHLCSWAQAHKVDRNETHLQPWSSRSASGCATCTMGEPVVAMHIS